MISAAAKSELTPTGKLRVGINFSNELLTVKSTMNDPEPRGIALASAKGHVAEALHREGNAALPDDISGVGLGQALPYGESGTVALQRRRQITLIQ
jgi:hypothetical protein